MAYTQERAIALVNAATDFYQAIIRIRKAIAEARNDLSYNKTDYQAAFNYISFFASESNENLFTDWTAAVTTLTIEHAHFSRSYKRNAREAERQREKRAHLPKREYVPRITAAPYTLITIPSTEPPKEIGRRGELEQKPNVDVEKINAQIERLRALDVDQVFIFNTPPTQKFDPANYKDDNEEKPNLPEDYDPDALPPPGSSMQ